MLRPKLYARLDRLGLGHLADRPTSAFRAGGALHALYRCRHAGDRSSPEAPACEEVTLTPREVAEPTCSCFTTAQNFPHLLEAVELAALVAQRPQAPVPSGTSPVELLAVSARLCHLESLVVALSWKRTTDPSIAALRDRFEADLAAECTLLRARLHAEGPPAVLLREAADVSSWGAAAAELCASLVEVLGQLSAPAVVEAWVSLVESGTSRSERRRLLSALVGSLLLDVPGRSGGNPVPPLRPLVLGALEAVDRLEERLEERLASPGEEFLLLTQVASSRDRDGYHRLLVEAFTVATGGTDRLLVVPASVLRRFGALAGPRRPLRTALLPLDRAQAETAVRLWDPDGSGPLFDPVGLVEAAARV